MLNSCSDSACPFFSQTHILIFKRKSQASPTRSPPTLPPPLRSPHLLLISSWSGPRCVTAGLTHVSAGRTGQKKIFKKINKSQNLHRLHCINSQRAAAGGQSLHVLHEAGYTKKKAEATKVTNRKHSCDKQTKRGPARQMEEVFGVFFVLW